MPRRALALAWLLAGVSAVAVESSPPSVAPAVKEAMPVPDQATATERKPVERKAGEAPKSSRDTPKPFLPLLDEKNLGLGCAQG